MVKKAFITVWLLNLTHFDSSMNDPNANHAGVHSGPNLPNSSNENAVILGLVNSTIPTIQANGINTRFMLNIKQP